MQNDRLPAEVRLARAEAARRFVAAYCAEQRSRPRPRPAGLDSYLESNQKRVRR